MEDHVVQERRSIQKQPLSNEEPVRLCSRCANLDINKLWSSTSTKVALGTIASWNPDSCVFCKFLSDILSPIFGTHDQEQLHQSSEIEVLSDPRPPHSYYLYSMKSRQSSERLLQILEPRIIVLSPSEHGPPPEGIPYIAVHPTKPPFWLKQIQPLLDFEQLKGWLNVCTQLHAGHCSGNQDNIVANLRLIDCDTGEVTKAKENDSYVALSYVWGHNDASRQISSKYPPTIQDAITATRKLGYTRLWVDKYCINQKDRLETQKQLQQMDSIYKQAVVTLIAAAGIDEDYGLPGVSERYRVPTSSVKVRQQSLSAIRGTPDLSSENCKWISRAWVRIKLNFSLRICLITS